MEKLLLGTCLICQHIIPEVSIRKKKTLVQDSNNGYLTSVLLECMLGEKSQHSFVEYMTIFCPVCETYLRDWREISIQVSQLLTRANHIKATISAFLLASAYHQFPPKENNLNDGSVNGTKIRCCPEAFRQKLDQIKKKLIGEYGARVVLEKLNEINLPLPDPSFQITSKIDSTREISLKTPDVSDGFNTPEKTFPLERDTLDISNGRCDASEAGSDTDFSPDNFDDPVISDDEEAETLQIKTYSKVKPTGTYVRSRLRSRSSLIRAESKAIFEVENSDEEHDSGWEKGEGQARPKWKPNKTIISVDDKPKSKALNRNKINYKKLYSLVTAGPDEPDVYYYAEKYRLYYKDKKFHCSTCSFSHSSRGNLLLHIRLDHIGKESKQDLSSKEPALIVRKVFDVVSTGPNEYLYGGKFRVTFENGKYRCAECGRESGHRPSIMQHVRNFHFDKDVQPSLAQKFLPIQEIGEDEFLYAGKYRLFRRDGKYHCGQCSKANTIKHRVLHHIRNVHMRKNVKPPPAKKEPGGLGGYTQLAFVPTGPNEFLYGGKCRVTLIDGRYHCSMCPATRSRRPNLLAHIKNVHFRGQETREKNPMSVRTGPNEYLYMYKFPLRFIQSEKSYVCGLCDHKGTIVQSIYMHIRQFHFTDEDWRLTSITEVRPNEYLYAGKYPIFYRNLRYECGLCEQSRTVRHELYPHIIKQHFPAAAEQRAADHVNDPAAAASSGEHTDLVDNEPTPVADAPQGANDGPGIAENEIQSSDVGTGKLTSEMTPCQWESNDEGPTNEDLVGVGRNLKPLSAKEFLYAKRIRITIDDDGDYICGECGLDWPDVPYVIDHIRKQHPKNKPAKDAQDEWRAISKGKYARGSFIVEKEGEMFKCLSCGKLSPLRNIMFLHVCSSHIKPARKPIKDLSDMSFVYHNIPFKFDPVEKKFKCSLCPLGYSVKQVMHSHLMSAHLGLTPKQVCDICGKEFKNIVYLQRHVRLHKGKRFKCDECGKEFASRAYLRDHLNVHRGEEGKKYQCEFCGRKFMTSKQLKNHVPTHTGEKPFPCDLCGESFANSLVRRKHRKKFHDGAPVPHTNWRLKAAEAVQSTSN